MPFSHLPKELKRRVVWYSRVQEAVLFPLLSRQWARDIQIADLAVPVAKVVWERHGKTACASVYYWCEKCEDEMADLGLVVKLNHNLKTNFGRAIHFRCRHYTEYPAPLPPPISDRAAAAIIRNLVRWGADARHRQSVALILATQAMHPNAVEALLHGGADPHAVPNKNWLSPLEVAVQNNDVHTVSALLKAGADVTKSKCRVIRLAALGHRTRITRLLVTSGNFNPATVVQQMLLDKGAFAGWNKEKRNLLSQIRHVFEACNGTLVAQYGWLWSVHDKPDIIQFFVDNGATLADDHMKQDYLLNSLKGHHHTMLETLLNNACPVNRPANFPSERVPLVACLTLTCPCKYALLTRLLTAGADPSWGKNMVFKNATTGGDVQALTILLDRYSPKHNTLLFPKLVKLAAIFSQWAVVKFLLARGAEPTSCVLHSAVEANEYEIVDLVIEKGVDVRTGNDEALRLCLQTGVRLLNKGPVGDGVLRRLLVAGARVDEGWRGQFDWGGKEMEWAQRAFTGSGSAWWLHL